MIENAYDILVIVLSIVLFIFLVVSIVVALLVAKLVASVRHIIDKGVLIADKAESAVDSLQRSASVAGAAKLLGGFLTMFHKSNKGSK